MQTLPAGRHLQFLHSSLAEQKSSALGKESSQSHPSFRHLQFLHFSFAPQKLSALGRLSSQSHPESHINCLLVTEEMAPPLARHLHCLQVSFLGQKLSALGRVSSQSHPGSKCVDLSFFNIVETDLLGYTCTACILNQRGRAHQGLMSFRHNHNLDIKR